jgi:pSer/pThr/pTyr-binding forkhead associated (FHA) protein
MSTKAYLFWNTLQGEARQTELTQEMTIIGRGHDCDISILDERVSRQHVEIYFDGDAYLVSDLGSFNGTILNGETLGDTRPLKDGDQLQIGPVKLRFEWGAAPDETPRSTLVIPEVSLQGFLLAHDGTRFELYKELSTIGRGQGWDICLHDRAVSRPHAEIARQGDKFVLTDLESANGTLLNGQRISEPQTLKEDDSILFGEHPLTFKIEKSQA